MTTSPDRRTAQERGIKMGNRVIEPAGPRISQLITATIHLTGDQELRIDTHGSHPDRGGHIGVASDSVLIYLHDQKSAGAYARAWIDAWYVAWTHSFPSGQQRSIVLTACRGKSLSVSWLARPCGFVRSDVPCVLLWRSRHSCVRSLFPRSSCVANRRADGIRAMPSARALLVASLLTEPPYGCLGPSGNDRYRKRSLRSQTVGASQVNCQVAAALSQ